MWLALDQFACPYRKLVHIHTDMQSCYCRISRATFLKAMVNLDTSVARDIRESTKQCFVSCKLQSQICTSGTPYCTEAASYVIYPCVDRHEYVGNASISNITALVQILAWCQLRSKLLSELMGTNQSCIYIKITRSQYINEQRPLTSHYPSDVFIP